MEFWAKVYVAIYILSTFRTFFLHSQQAETGTNAAFRKINKRQPITSFVFTNISQEPIDMSRLAIIGRTRTIETRMISSMAVCSIVELTVTYENVNCSLLVYLFLPTLAVAIEFYSTDWVVWVAEASLSSAVGVEVGGLVTDRTSLR